MMYTQEIPQNLKQNKTKFQKLISKDIIGIVTSYKVKGYKINIKSIAFTYADIEKMETKIKTQCHLQLLPKKGNT